MWTADVESGSNLITLNRGIDRRSDGKDGGNYYSRQRDFGFTLCGKDRMRTTVSVQLVVESGSGTWERSGGSRDRDTE